MATWQKADGSDNDSALGRVKLGYAKFRSLFHTYEIASVSSDMVDIYLFINS